jgi:hypothetical protein
MPTHVCATLAVRELCAVLAPIPPSLSVGAGNAAYKSHDHPLNGGFLVGPAYLTCRWRADREDDAQELFKQLQSGRTE